VDGAALFRCTVLGIKGTATSAASGSALMKKC
jgi:hypothetical protein